MPQVSLGERALLEYVLKNVHMIFPGYKIVSTEELLYAGIRLDLHLRNKEGDDVFVEVKPSQIGWSEAGKVMDYYSAISNLSSVSKNFKLVIIGAGIDQDLRQNFKDLNILFMSFDELGISPSKLLTKHRKLRRRILTPTEARLVLSLGAESPKTIDTASVAQKFGVTRNYAGVLLHRLERKEWVERVAKGVYTLIPAAYGYRKRFPAVNPFLIMGSLASPYYVSYATANAHYGFTTQMPSTYYIATTKKRPTFEWRNMVFRFITLTRNKFFGFREETIMDARVNIAEPEKAVVDSLDKIRYAGGIWEVVRVIHHGWQRVDREKLVGYAVRMGVHSVCQRLGFILDYMAAKGLLDFPTDFKKELLKGVGKAPIPLNPSGSLRGSFSKEWRVVMNLGDKELLSEVELF